MNPENDRSESQMCHMISSSLDRRPRSPVLPSEIDQEHAAISLPDTADSLSGPITSVASHVRESSVVTVIFSFASPGHRAAASIYRGKDQYLAIYYSSSGIWGVIQGNTLDVRKQLSAKMAAAAATSATSRVSFSTAAGVAMEVEAMMAVRKTRKLVCILMVRSDCLKMRVFLESVIIVTNSWR